MSAWFCSVEMTPIVKSAKARPLLKKDGQNGNQKHASDHGADQPVYSFEQFLDIGPVLHQESFESKYAAFVPTVLLT
jgi:hypothetical protein